MTHTHERNDPLRIHELMEGERERKDIPVRKFIIENPINNNNNKWGNGIIGFY